MSKKTGIGFITIALLEDGAAAYLHTRYSDDGGYTFTDNGGTVIGTWVGYYSSNDPVAPTDPSLYSWSRVGVDTIRIDCSEGLTMASTMESRTLRAIVSRNGADMSGYDMDDVFTFEWYRGETLVGSGRTYTINGSDIGENHSERISVKAIYRDGSGRVGGADDVSFLLDADGYFIGDVSGLAIAAKYISGYVSVSVALIEDTWEVRAVPSAISLSTNSTGAVEPEEAYLVVHKNGEEAKQWGGDEEGWMPWTITLSSLSGSGGTFTSGRDDNGLYVQVSSVDAQLDSDGNALKLGTYDIPVSEGYLSAYVKFTDNYNKEHTQSVRIPFSVDISMAWSQQILTNEEFSSTFKALTGENGTIAQLESKITQTATQINSTVSAITTSVDNLTDDVTNLENSVDGLETSKADTTTVQSMIDQTATQIVAQIINKLGAAGITIYTNSNGVPCLRLQGGQISFADETGKDTILVAGAGTFAFLNADGSVAYNLGNKGMPSVINGSTSQSFTAVAGRVVQEQTYTLASLHDMVAGTGTTYYRYTASVLDGKSVSAAQQAYDGLYFVGDTYTTDGNYLPADNAASGLLWCQLEEGYYALYRFSDGAQSLMCKVQILEVYDQETGDITYTAIVNDTDNLEGSINLADYAMGGQA